MSIKELTLLNNLMIGRASLSSLFMEYIDSNRVDYSLKELTGGDVIIINKIMTEYIYIPNNTNPLSFDDVKNIFIQLESLSKKSDRKSYRIVSIGGYSTNSKDDPNVYDFESLNIKLDDITYVMWFFGMDEGVDAPYVDLNAYNSYTYNKIKQDLSRFPAVCAVQPTGTGKSFLIAKCISDLLDKGILLFSSTNYILNQFYQTFPWLNSNPRVRLMTYAKTLFLTDKEKDELIEFSPGICILDEYHRVGASLWSKSLFSLIRSIEDQKKQDVSITNSRVKLIGFSATPIRVLDNNRDMSEEIFDGNISNVMTLSDAIVKGILPKPKYVTAFHSLDSEITKMQDKISRSKNDSRSKRELQKKLEKLKIDWENVSGVPFVLQKHVDINLHNKIAVFCEDIDHLNKMIDMCKEWFKDAFGSDMPVHTYVVTSKNKRSDIEFSEFISTKKRGFHLLFSINRLIEGIHSDEITAVLLLRKTMSVIVHMQSIGRAFKANSMRTPLILDLVNNISLVQSNFLVKGFRDALVNEDRFRNELGVKSADKQLEEFSSCIVDETLDIVNELGVIESSLKKSWMSMYYELKKFYELNGHCNVPFDYIDSYLASWVRVQYKSYNRGNLANEKVDLLNELHFFDNKVKKVSQFDYLKQLEDFYIENGHTKVDKSHGNLYVWVCNCRTKYRKNTLNKDVIERLKRINFVFDLTVEAWENNFQQLYDYYKKNKNTRLPSTEEYSKLKRWRDNQLKSYKVGKLSPYQISKLKSIEVIKENSKDPWTVNYNKLFEFFKINGHSWVTNSHEDIPLYYWVLDQRKLRNKGLLSDDKVSLLDSINFIWDTVDYTWNLRFEELKRYYEVNGDYNIPKTDEFMVLYRWTHQQKNKYKKGTLTPERLKLLTDINYLQAI